MEGGREGERGGGGEGEGEGEGWKGRKKEGLRDVKEEEL